MTIASFPIVLDWTIASFPGSMFLSLDCDPEIRLFVSLFPFFAPIFSISFNCEIIFFPLATLSPLSDSFPFPLHHNFLSFVLLRSKLSTTPANFYSTPHLLFRATFIYLPSLHFPHTFEKRGRNNPEQIFNPLYLSRKNSRLSAWVVKIQPRVTFLERKENRSRLFSSNPPS